MYLTVVRQSEKDLPWRPTAAEVRLPMFIFKGRVLHVQLASTGF